MLQVVALGQQGGHCECSPPVEGPGDDRDRPIEWLALLDERWLTGAGGVLLISGRGWSGGRGAGRSTWVATGCVRTGAG